MRLRFRQCRPQDVALLDRLDPSPSLASFHVNRFERQTAGVGTYLLAWRRRSLVGHAEILWDGCRDAAVNVAHPHCPEINALDVFPESVRSQGIGSALIRACEDLARERGRSRIGLGVADSNPRAAGLYQRLGYTGSTRYLDRYTCIDSMGNRYDFADPCVFLTRAINTDDSDLRHRANGDAQVADCFLSIQ